MKFNNLVLSLTLLVTFSACSKKDDSPQLSSGKDLTVFTIDTAKGIIDAANHTVTLTMPASTDVTKLTPAITISDKATISPATGVAQDFTSPVTYTVKAQDGSTQAYTVTVKKLSGAAILSFEISLPYYEVAFAGETDPTNELVIRIGLTDYQKSVATEVKPTITLSPGATIVPASGTMVDLSKPFTYTVTSEKGEVRAYTVKVVNNQQYFGFSAPYMGTNKLGDHPGITATLEDDNLFPEDIKGLSGNFGVFEALETENVSNLKLNVTIPTGMTVSPDPATPQNYNSDVKYTLTNEWGVTSTFTVRCIKRKSIIIQGDLLKNGHHSSYNAGVVYYWADAEIDRLWYIDVKTGTQYDLTVTSTMKDDYTFLSWYWPEDSVTEGEYYIKVQMSDGTVTTSRYITSFSKD